MATDTPERRPCRRFTRRDRIYGAIVVALLLLELALTLLLPPHAGPRGPRGARGPAGPPGHVVYVPAPQTSPYPLPVSPAPANPGSGIGKG